MVQTNWTSLLARLPALSHSVLLMQCKMLMDDWRSLPIALTELQWIKATKHLQALTTDTFNQLYRQRDVGRRLVWLLNTFK